ncbi:MAG TPA: NPCBM/NEW2 domain-containing protein [Gemmataceae bacterium]|nr:NPCBM/NEW2 domain-containing protein [Gemmataceae bacterium]
MPAKRALLLFVVCVSVALAADPPELRPLKGEKFKGDLVSLNEKEIVLQVNGKPVATPVEGTLQLDFRAPTSPTGTYTQVELADGSILRCSKVEFKNKDAVLTLLSGQVATVPMALLGVVMQEANDVKLVAAWKELLGTTKRPYDVLVRKKADGKLGYLEGTFYDASAAGDTIQFKIKDEEAKENIGVAKIYGIVFSRQPDPNMPGRACEVLDAQGAKLFAKSVVLKEGKFLVDTQCGARVEYPADALARLDYSKGKLTFLSDVEVSRVKLVQVARQGRTPEFRRDRNPDNTGDIRVAGKRYEKGLVMHAKTEVTFDLEGEYREFKAVAGIDDNVTQGSEEPVLLRIEGDGKELLTLNVTRKEGAKPINLNIKDVQKLRVVIDSTPENLLGLGSIVDLADAKVSK